jgi:hypothetical protein
VTTPFPGEGIQDAVNYVGCGVPTKVAAQFCGKERCPFFCPELNSVLYLISTYVPDGAVRRYCIYSQHFTTVLHSLFTIMSLKPEDPNNAKTQFLLP